MCLIYSTEGGAAGKLVENSLNKKEVNHYNCVKIACYSFQGFEKDHTHRPNPEPDPNRNPNPKS